MKQAGLLLVLVAFVVAAPLLAEGPDDQFIRIYSLIQQGDSFANVGRNADAQERYREALTLLQQFEKDYPRWNDEIVKYRTQYLQERAGTAPARNAPSTASTNASPSAPKEDPRVASLSLELDQLRADYDRLQAKLREALTAQPAAVDPRELAKATERADTLRKENEDLKSRITAQEQKLSAAVEPAKLEEAQKALADARADVARNTKSLDELSRRNESLQRDLQKATARLSSKEKAETAKADKQSQKDLAAANARISELSDKLRGVEKDLTDERSRTRVLLAEKETIEKRVAELNSLRARDAEEARKAREALVAAAKPAAAPPAAPAPKDVAPKEPAPKESPKPAEPKTAPAPVPAPVKEPEKVAPAKSESAKPVTAEEKRMAKYQREVDKARIKQLERERDELNKRIRFISRQLEDVKRQTGSTNSTSGTDQLAILRARLEAYEARAVPLTSEEQALLKPSATLPATMEEKGMKRQMRQVPAGAATLLAEAQRAFQGRRYDEAERKFSQALQLDERNVDMLTYLAASQLEQERFAEAEATLKRALAVDPDNPDGVSLMGLMRYRQGKYDEALDLLSRAAQLNPDNPNTQNYLGVTLAQRGQRKPAETALRRAVVLDPNYGEAHANLAAAYMLQQPPSIELVRFHYQKALALGQPRNPEIEKALQKAAPEAATK